MLDYSIGELESLVFKAYRGCGQSWGLAQEAGVAAAGMALSGLPSARAFAALLPLIDGKAYQQLSPTDVRSNRWSASDACLCPVITGVALSDFNTELLNTDTPLLIEQVVQPTIVLPFLCRLAVPVEVQLDNGVNYRCCEEGICFAGGCSEAAHALSPATMCLTVSAEKTGPVRQQQRAEIDDKSLQTLLGFAHRTYVPASDSSRAGAGAGLLDND